MAEASHYYVALGAPSHLLATLVDLVRALGADRCDDDDVPGVPVAVVCASRDGLDDAATAILDDARADDARDRRPPAARVSRLHSDQTPGERAATLASFRASARGTDANRGDPSRARGGAKVLVATDACLPSAAVGEAPLALPVLVNFGLPRDREAYARRVKTALGGGGGTAGVGNTAGARVVVNIVLASDVENLRAMETDEREIAEMPIDLLHLARERWARAASERAASRRSRA